MQSVLDFHVEWKSNTHLLKASTNRLWFVANKELDTQHVSPRQYEL